MFGISDKDLMDPNKIKIIDGIAGSGKSTSTVNELRRLGSKFCLASFSNALKFAAFDKFNCDVDTICGLEFVNTPFPRYCEKDVEGYDTVVNDEILLDGVECINWMETHIGKINIIALTDSKQMLNADNGRAAIKAFDKLCKSKDTIYVNVNTTRRARDNETVEMYDKLYKLNSRAILTINEVKELFNCDIVDMDNVDFSKDNTYLCHSNAIEHEIYKKYKLNSRNDIDLIPKNHISRKRDVDITKYPVCDQMTAEKKRVNAYLQAANVATPTRFQGKEVVVGNECYFVVKEGDMFTGREIYTVGTRCQTMKSLHIAVMRVQVYEEPTMISGRKVGKAQRLSIEADDKTFKCVTPSKMVNLIKKYGEKDVTYLADMILSGDNVVYSTLNSNQLKKFAKFEGNEVKLNKDIHSSKKSIRSIVKKDSTMHFDFMDGVYSKLGRDITPPRIVNPHCNKSDFTTLCDIYSAFPTILMYGEMPAAGYLYETYDPELLNFYVYKGDRVTKGSLITEELAKKLGDSEYVFSTEKQVGCEIGRYTYEQSRKSKESKNRINKEFLWGKLESGYYTMTETVCNGKAQKIYVKHSQNNLELVACALWSKLCLIMIEAIESIGVTEYVVITDGLYYNGNQIPTLPEWCDYRIEDKSVVVDSDEKYKNVVTQSYENLKTEKEIKRERERERRKNMSPEQKAAEAERKRKSRAAKKASSRN